MDGHEPAALDARYTWPHGTAQDVLRDTHVVPAPCRSGAPFLLEYVYQYLIVTTQVPRS